MRVEVKREEMLACLDLVSKGVSQRSTLPVLSTVLLKATAPQEGVTNGVLELTTTNLELAIQLPMSATVHKPGAAAVPFRVLVETLKEIGDESVTFELDVERFIVRFGKGQAALFALGADEFPLTPVAPDDELGIRVPVANMQRLIGRTAFAAAKDEVRPVLAGVLMEINPETRQLRAVATDGYRLALADEAADHIPDYAPLQPLPLAQAEGVTLTKPIQNALTKAGIVTVDDVIATERSKLVGIKGVGEKTVDHLLTACKMIADRRVALRTSFVVPSGSLEVINRIISKVECEHVMMFQSRLLTFQIGAALVSTQIIDGNYPEYRAVLPNEEKAKTTLLFVCEALRDALKLTEVLAKHAGHSAKARIAEKDGQTGIFLAAASAEHGDNSQFVPAVLDGNKMELAFNSKFVCEVLDVMGEDVFVRLFSPAEPIVMRPDSNPDAFLYLVMPMQFSKPVEKPTPQAQPIPAAPVATEPVAAASSEEE